MKASGQREEPWIRDAIRQRLRDERRLKEETIARTVDAVLERSQRSDAHPLEEVINETLYHEHLRLNRSREPRTAADLAFYADIRRQLPHSGYLRLRQFVHDIVARYATEIAGHFDPRIYTVATRALPIGLSVLLHGFSPAKVLQARGRVPSIDDRLLFEGEMAVLRNLARLGTVILVPTHSSNLDSLLMGYAIYRMGLPPFAYGAGLNLFGNPVLSFFMHHLGAYTVDRTKTDPLYRETLKEYATVSLEYGEHNLFFPGGTRSRSGGLESHLKKGLLGAGITAYRHNLKRGHLSSRIFIVPCTVTYPLVLEAATLISDYLQASGKSRYIIADDEFTIFERWRDFFRGLLALDARVHVVIGQALDPFGNRVDAEGQSLDPHGRTLDASRYLSFRGELVDDHERDAEYTRTLSSRVVEAYQRDTVALPTSILAYACLELLRQRSHQPDIYRFLRSIGPGSSVPMEAVEKAVDQIVRELQALAKLGRIRLSDEAQTARTPALIDNALSTFATYHTTPVIERSGMRLQVGDSNLLFYYRNRLDTYGLLGAPPLLPLRGEP